MLTIVFISLITTPQTTLTARKAERAKQSKAPTSNDKLSDPLGARSARQPHPHPLALRWSKQVPAPCSLLESKRKQVIALHSLVAMPGRLPTTKDFPSTVKLSIVPRKYVSHSATP